MILAALLFAQTAACAAVDAALPEPLAAWTTPGQGDPADLTRPVVFKAVDSSQVTGLPAGTHPGAATAVGFRIARAGVYGIAIDQKAWIDVMPGFEGGTAPLRTVSHRDGDPCWSIRKIVRYQLAPGDYRLAITGLSAPQVKVMLEQGA